MKIGLDERLLIWTLITFGGLVALLARFAFRPLQRLVDERERTIRDSLDQAQKARAEAEAIRGQGAAQIEAAREAARRLMEDSRKLAADADAEVRRQARVEAEALVSRAREEIDRDVRRGLDELKDTVANLSVRVSREFIKDSLDEKRHRELVDEFIERLKAEHTKPGA
jgi:F-type H+-transporting ATPase subunit b